MNASSVWDRWYSTAEGVSAAMELHRLGTHNLADFDFTYVYGEGNLGSMVVNTTWDNYTVAANTTSNWLGSWACIPFELATKNNITGKVPEWFSYDYCTADSFSAAIASDGPLGTAFMFFCIFLGSLLPSFWVLSQQEVLLLALTLPLPQPLLLNLSSPRFSSPFPSSRSVPLSSATPTLTPNFRCTTILIVFDTEHLTLTPFPP